MRARAGLSSVYFPSLMPLRPDKWVCWRARNFEERNRREGGRGARWVGGSRARQPAGTGARSILRRRESHGLYAAKAFHSFIPVAENKKAKKLSVHTRPGSSNKQILYYGEVFRRDPGSKQKKKKAVSLKIVVQDSFER